MHVRPSEVPLFHPTPSLLGCGVLSTRRWVGMSGPGSEYFKVAQEIPAPQQGPLGSTCQRRHGL